MESAADDVEVLSPDNGAFSPDEIPADPSKIFWFAILIEIGLAAAALGIGHGLGFCDAEQKRWPLEPERDWLRVAGWSAAGLAIMLAVALVVMAIPATWARQFLELVRMLVRRLFGRTPAWQIAVISLAAGTGEELFFRWMLQGGLAQLWPGTWPQFGAVAAAAVVFGLAHYLNTVYFLLATAIGVLLGTLMVVSGTVWAPIIAHGVYDFVVLMLLTRPYRRGKK